MVTAFQLLKFFRGSIELLLKISLLLVDILNLVELPGERLGGVVLLPLQGEFPLKGDQLGEDFMDPRGYLFRKRGLEQTGNMGFDSPDFGISFDRFVLDHGDLLQMHERLNCAVHQVDELLHPVRFYVEYFLLAGQVLIELVVVKALLFSRVDRLLAESAELFEGQVKLLLVVLLEPYLCLLYIILVDVLVANRACGSILALTLLLLLYHWRVDQLLNSATECAILQIGDEFELGGGEDL